MIAHPAPPATVTSPTPVRIPLAPVRIPAIVRDPAPDPNPARFAVRLTLALLAVGVLCRLTRYLVQGAFWGDECMVGINLISRDFAGLTRLLDYQQVAPVPFLWAERVALLLLGSSELALRLLPLLAGVAGLVVFWDFARRAVSPAAAAVAVGTLAAARWPVYLSATAKPYAGDLLAAAVLLWLAHRWHANRQRLWPLAVLVFAGPLAVVCSFPAVFAAGGIGLALLAAAWHAPDRRAWRLAVAYNLLTAGTFLANFLFVIRPQSDPAAGNLLAFMADYWKHGFPPADPLGFLGWLWNAHTGRLFAYPIGDRGGASLVPFLLFAAGAWAVFRNGNRFLVGLCLLPFGLTFAAAVVGKYPYGGCCRLAQHLAPAICLLVGVGTIEAINRVWKTPLARGRGLVAVALVLGGFGLGQVAFDIAFPDRDGISVWSRDLREELEAELGPGDRVLMASPRYMTDETTAWQLARLGGRVCWDAADVPADAPRVWVLTLTDGPTGEPMEAAAVAKLAGRVEASRRAWLPPVDRRVNFQWHARAVCLRNP